MKKFFFAQLIFFLFCQSVSARSFVVGLSSEYRTEENTENQIIMKNFEGFFLAATPFTQDNSLWLWVEKNRFIELTGNASLSTDRVHENWSFKIKKQTYLYHFLDVLLGAGLGFYHERIETQLLTQRQRDYSDNYFTASALAGIKFNVPWIWLSAEVAAEYWQNWNPQPNLSIGLRLGLQVP